MSKKQVDKIKELELRILELEVGEAIFNRDQEIYEQVKRNADFLIGELFHRISDQKEIITKLRKALEEIGEDFTVDNTWLVNNVRTTLRECFGEKNE